MMPFTSQHKAKKASWPPEMPIYEPKKVQKGPKSSEKRSKIHESPMQRHEIKLENGRVTGCFSSLKARCTSAAEPSKKDENRSSFKGNSALETGVFHRFSPMFTLFWLVQVADIAFHCREGLRLQLCHLLLQLPERRLAPHGSSQPVDHKTCMGSHTYMSFK